MHLPVSSEETLHFYRDLCTHVLIVDEQFLLLTDVPIQHHAKQLTTSQDISSLQFSNTTWKLISMLQHRYQVFRHNLSQNKNRRNLGTTVHDMSTGKHSFAALTHLSNHLPTHCHVLQLSMSRTKQGLRKDTLYSSGI